MSAPHVRDDIRALKGYSEEHKGGLNLAANTNLFGSNPALDRALARTRPADLVDYPTITSQPLRAALAHRMSIHQDQIVTGNGSNDLIDILLRTFVEPGDAVAYHPPTFSMIPLFARMNHGRPAPVPLDPEDWSLDPDALIGARGKLTFVVRPNNPTGNAFPRRDVERIVANASGIVVIDEAYVEFLGGESFVKEVREGAENLIVLRTFSKAHGMAGVRAGYAVASEAITEQLLKVRGPFRLDVLAETAASLALQDEKFVHQTVEGVRSERPILKRLLEERGFEVFRSDGNFLLTRPPVPAAALARALAERGILVRDFSADLSEFLRITVGPPAVTARFRVALDGALAALQGGTEA